MTDALAPNAIQWTEGKIAIGLALRYGTGKNVVLPNYAAGLTGQFEDDLVVVRPSGWCEAVEIKVSLSDYRVEFRKKTLRHRILTEGIPNRVGNPRWRGVRDPALLAEWERLLQLPTSEIKYWRETPEEILDWSNTKPHMCKRFWFAMPEELALKLKDEVPSYAGIVCVKRGRYGSTDFREIRPAPSLKHAQKIDARVRAHILQCAYYRFWDMKLAMERREAVAQ